MKNLITFLAFVMAFALNAQVSTQSTLSITFDKSETVEPQAIQEYAVPTTMMFDNFLTTENISQNQNVKIKHLFGINNRLIGFSITIDDIGRAIYTVKSYRYFDELHHKYTLSDDSEVFIRLNDKKQPLSFFYINKVYQSRWAYSNNAREDFFQLGNDFEKVWETFKE